MRDIDLIRHLTKIQKDIEDIKTKLFIDPPENHDTKCESVHLGIDDPCTCKP